MAEKRKEPEQPIGPAIVLGPMTPDQIKYLRDLKESMEEVDGSEVVGGKRALDLMERKDDAQND